MIVLRVGLLFVCSALEYCMDFGDYREGALTWNSGKVAVK